MSHTTDPADTMTDAANFDPSTGLYRRVLLFQLSPEFRNGAFRTRVWWCLFDREARRVVDVQYDAKDAERDPGEVLAEITTRHPDAPLYTMSACPPWVSEPYAAYQRRSREIMDDLTKGW